MKAAIAVLAGIVLLALLAPYLSPYAFDQPHWDRVAQAPTLAGWQPFGTDAIGRDLFVRTLHGGRISLMVGLAATLVALVIGVAWGATAGYLGGRVDGLMMRTVDVLYALPFIFLVILLMVMFGRNMLLLFLVIGAIMWLDMARIVRGQALALKQRGYVDAARAAGVSEFAIIGRHIIPNLWGVALAYAALTVPQVILVESFLSFLGLGVQEPYTSWGALISDGAREMENAPWMLIFPAAFLAATLLCLNVIGDGLRDRANAR